MGRDFILTYIWRTIGPSLAASLESLTQHWNVASLSLFWRYYLSRCLSEMAQLVSLPYSWGSNWTWLNINNKYIFYWCKHEPCYNIFSIELNGKNKYFKNTLTILAGFFLFFRFCNHCNILFNFVTTIVSICQTQLLWGLS